MGKYLYTITREDPTPPPVKYVNVRMTPDLIASVTKAMRSQYPQLVDYNTSDTYFFIALNNEING